MSIKNLPRKYTSHIRGMAKHEQPREKLIEKGPENLRDSELMAILLRTGIEGKDVMKVSSDILNKFPKKKLLALDYKKLADIKGIGPGKACLLLAAFELTKRALEVEDNNLPTISNAKDAVAQLQELRTAKKEHFVVLYLNARIKLVHKETISIGTLSASLVHPREVFKPAIEHLAASVILAHNHPSGEVEASEEDLELFYTLIKASTVLGVNILDFVIISKNSKYSFFEKHLNNKSNKNIFYVCDGAQISLFNFPEVKKSSFGIATEQIKEEYFYIPKVKKNYIQLQNRRYIGSKHKLIEWIFSILEKECKGDSFADIFAGTGIVSAIAAKHYDKIILNDFLCSNYVIYQAFFGKGKWDENKIENIIKNFNNIDYEGLDENYFSKNFGGKYFSHKSSKIIGAIRQNIEDNKENLTEKEYNMLIASLLYSIDKIANTVGHYDAFFKKDFVYDNFFMRPIDPIYVKNITIYREDTNLLAKRIKAEIVYLDPPYNSRQYSRFYHVLETLTKWNKPDLYGVALKPEPENMSDYCRIKARNKLEELVRDLNAKYLVVSYNNTYESKSNSSKNKITLQEIRDILDKKGNTKIFEKDYRHFNAGNTNFNNHKEYLFVTKV